MKIVKRVVVVLGFAFFGCSPATHSSPAPQAAAPESLVEPGIDDASAEPGLIVRIPGVSTDGRIAKIRGTVHNRLSEPVHGVRYLVLLLGDGPRPQVLDSFRKESGETIEAGQTGLVRLDIESMYFGRIGGIRFVVEAAPKRVGEREVPPPPEWDAH